MGWAGTDTPLIRTGTWLRWKRCAHVSRTRACSLGIPTLSPDILEFPGGRIYGPIRLPRLLRGFKLVARIWDGHVLSGNLSQARRDPALYPTRRSIWKNGKLWNGNINQSWCSKKAGRGLATARAVRTVAAKSRRHSPPNQEMAGHMLRYAPNAEAKWQRPVHPGTHPKKLGTAAR